MKKLFKLMFQNYPLRAADGADGADGGGADKNADLAAQVAALTAQVEKLTAGKKDAEPAPTDADKVRAELEAKAKKEAETARMQDAIKFNLGVSQFVADNKDYLGKLAEGLVKTVNEKQFSDEVRKAAEDSYKRLIAPSIETEIRNMLTERAQESAIDLFSVNLKNLLMTPPVKGRVVLGVDPGYRTGCKLAVVDSTGKVLETGVGYFTLPHHDKEKAKKQMT
ncbi:MAG: hypothetical protein ACI4Q7_00205, partial [Candidatus Avelusimicrobium sp.]